MRRARPRDSPRAQPPLLQTDGRPPRVFKSLRWDALSNWTRRQARRAAWLQPRRQPGPRPANLGTTGHDTAPVNRRRRLDRPPSDATRSRVAVESELPRPPPHTRARPPAAELAGHGGKRGARARDAGRRKEPDGPTRGGRGETPGGGAGFGWSADYRGTFQGAQREHRGSRRSRATRDLTWRLRGGRCGAVHLQKRRRPRSAVSRPPPASREVGRLQGRRGRSGLDERRGTNGVAGDRQGKARSPRCATPSSPDHRGHGRFTPPDRPRRR